MATPDGSSTNTEATASAVVPAKKLFGRAFSELSPLNPKVLCNSTGAEHAAVQQGHMIFPNWSIFRHVRSSSVQVKTD